MYSYIGICRKHNLAIDCKLDMFDKNGCEVWGSHRTELIEKLHLKFCKHTFLQHQTIWCTVDLDGIHLLSILKLDLFPFGVNYINSYPEF